MMTLHDAARLGDQIALRPGMPRVCRSRPATWRPDPALMAAAQADRVDVLRVLIELGVLGLMPADDKYRRRDPPRRGCRLGLGLPGVPCPRPASHRSGLPVPADRLLTPVPGTGVRYADSRRRRPGNPLKHYPPQTHGRGPATLPPHEARPARNHPRGWVRRDQDTLQVWIRRIGT